MGHFHSIKYSLLHVLNGKKKLVYYIIYFVIIAICAMVCYVYYFALFASLFTCMVGAAIMGFVFIMKVYSMKNSQAKFTYSKFLMFYLKMIG